MQSPAFSWELHGLKKGLHRRRLGRHSQHGGKVEGQVDEVHDAGRHDDDEDVQELLVHQHILGGGEGSPGGGAAAKLRERRIASPRRGRTAWAAQGAVQLECIQELLVHQHVVCVCVCVAFVCVVVGWGWGA